MPYSENSHSRLVASLLATASLLTTNADNLMLWLGLYSDMSFPRVDLHNKTVIVTGANSGIGYECARAFAGMGARVVLACRNATKGEEARRKIVADTGNDDVEAELLDCCSFESVKMFLGRWEQRESRQVDILINNAGGLTSTVAITPDGFEQTYQANHLAHVLLTISLLNRGYMSPDARIVSVSSVGSYSSDPLNAKNTGGSDILSKYNGKIGAKLSFEDMLQLYARSKAAQAMWTMALQRYLSQTERWKGVSVHSCHPGTVKSSIWSQPDGAGSMVSRASDLFKAFARTFGITNEQGAVVPVWLATASQPASPELRGMYWDRLSWKWVRPWSMETKRQIELWEKWCEDTQVSLVL
ncbi:short chain dehydrogenase [Ceratobasidium sp. AG-Ba]|nr:short chain dehydrogenase [Ceratobasidium sp. AG-Ba]